MIDGKRCHMGNMGVLVVWRAGLGVCVGGKGKGDFNSMFC